MRKKVKSKAAICMVLLFGLGLSLCFGSIRVNPYTPPSGETATYEFYCTGAVNWGCAYYPNASDFIEAPWPHPDYPAAQPTGFTFSTSIPYFKADNISEVPEPAPPFAPPPHPFILLYNSEILTIEITNNLEYDIEILDLTAEVTDSNETLPYVHCYAGNKTFAGLSMLAVDPLDPITDEVAQGSLSDPNDLDEHYKEFPGATGPEPNKYSDVYGPASLRQESDPDPTLPKADTTLLDPEPLAAGETYTDYFAVFWGGNACQGDQLYGTVTFNLVYEEAGAEAEFPWVWVAVVVVVIIVVVAAVAVAVRRRRK